MTDLEKELKDSPVDAFQLDVTEEELTRPGYVLKYTHSVQGLGKDNNKIAIRLTHVSKNDKEVIAQALAETIIRLNPPGIAVLAGDCPVMRGQWDFIVSYASDIHVSAVKHTLLSSIPKAFND